MERLAQDRNNDCDLACPEQIVVATDLADAERLIPYAIAEAKVNLAALTFVHAMQPDDTAESKSGVAATPRANRSADIRAAMEEITKLVRAAGVSCSTVVKSGPVADVVIEMIRRTGAGRLIVGTHARQGVDKFLLGSVARKLLESADVPVFIVGPQCKQASAGWSIKNILLASSSLNKSTPKAIVARSIAQHCNAQLTVLHVLTPDEHTTPEQQSTLGRSGTPAAMLLRRSDNEDVGQKLLARVTADDPAIEIVRVANEISADLIVIGVHHYPFHLPFGKEATAYRVLASAPCPVLTLKSDSALIRRHALTEARHTAVL